MKKKSQGKNYNADVIVIGGGLAGLSLSLLLAKKNKTVICFDRFDPDLSLSSAFDGRTTAISYGSSQILEQAGIWQTLQAQACPIEDIQILDSGSPVLLEFLAEEVSAEAFGWIIENRLLRQTLYEKVNQSELIQLVAPAQVADFDVSSDLATVILSDQSAYHAPLIIGADGRGSFTREWMGIETRDWSYNQHAVVCTAVHDNPHDHVAVEHFRPEGPFAILPMVNGPEGDYRSSVVWTQHGPEKESALHYDQDSFDVALTARFPDSYGGVRQIGQRFSYPLGFVHAHAYTGPRMALVADAAHGIHPIAGQGLNIGFRDIAALVNLIEAAEDPGGADLLKAYERSRRLDNMSMAAATDNLNKLFSNNIAPVRMIRKLGLKAVSRLRPAKHFFMRRAMGLKTGRLS